MLEILLTQYILKNGEFKCSKRLFFVIFDYYGEFF
jgi:hypothetical protein